jgi:hypothetical protein
VANTSTLPRSQLGDDGKDDRHYRCQQSICLGDIVQIHGLQGAKKPDGSFFFHLYKVQVNVSAEDLAEERHEMIQLYSSDDLAFKYPGNLEDDDLETMVGLKKWIIVQPLHVMLKFEAL